MSSTPYNDKIATSAENLQEIIISQAHRVHIDIEKDINSILGVDFDWEDSGLEKPLHQSLDSACDIMKSLIHEVFFYEELSTQWINPSYIYSNEAGYICITWICEFQDTYNFR